MMVLIFIDNAKNLICLDGDNAIAFGLCQLLVLSDWFTLDVANCDSANF